MIKKRTLTKRTGAIAVASGVLVLGAGIGAASLAQADPTASPSPTTSAQPGQPGPGGGPGGRGGHGPGEHGGRGGPFGADLKTLASKLGVTEAKLTEALKAIRDENKPSTPPSTKPTAPPSAQDRAARETALVKALASKLGLDEAKVKAAIDEIKAAHQADEAKQLKTKLDAAVKAGTLTQAEADAVTKAVEKGVIHGR